MKKVLLTSVFIFVILGMLLTFVSCSALGMGSNLQSSVIPVTGTAYVVTDASTEDDPQALRDQNYSTQDFVKIWYAWDVQSTEKVISIGLFKFDLSSIKGKEIKSATLQMYATRTDLAKAVRLVDVSLVDGTWDQSSVTYNSRPTWGSSSIATSAVYGAGVWYSWDVSASVAQKSEDGEISFVSGLNAMEDKSEEQVLFASSQATGGVEPRLIVTYTSANSSVLPWWIWVIGIVVIALIALFLGMWISRRSVRRKETASAETPAKKYGQA